MLYLISITGPHPTYYEGPWDEHRPVDPIGEPHWLVKYVDHDHGQSRVEERQFPSLDQAEGFAAGMPLYELASISPEDNHRG